MALESHSRFPKQFLCLVCEEGLFQQVARCLINLGALDAVQKVFPKDAEGNTHIGHWF